MARDNAALFRMLTVMISAVIVLCVATTSLCAPKKTDVVDATTLHHKIMCGYQGWFRCPGDGAGGGWVHWSRDQQRIAPDTLPFEMWPDMSAYSPSERYQAPGFTYPNGQQAELFSSYNPKTIERHFQWMRQYGIDGPFIQQFLVGVPGGPYADSYPNQVRFLQNVAASAKRNGRAWAISFDSAAMPVDKIYDALINNWKSLVDQGFISSPGYLHQDKKPVVQIWGFYHNNSHDQMTPEVGNKLIDFFKKPGKYQAYLIGGGDWDWRGNPDPQWQAMLRRFDAYSPWNIGNTSLDDAKIRHASMGAWPDDVADCQKSGVFWFPTVYPGFSWDNLIQKPAGTSLIDRRRGNFLWEQFYQLAKMRIDTIYVSMFDEVDEGTAIFKVTSQPPTQAHFVGYDGLPSDWYLRLVGAGAEMVHGKRPLTEEIPIHP